MAKKQNKKLNKPNVKMTPKEEKAIEEFKEAKTDLKERLQLATNNPIMNTLLDALKVFCLMLIIEAAIMLIPVSANFMGVLLGINETSSSNDMVMWQSCNTFVDLIIFYVMMILLKKIYNSISFVKKRKEKKNG